MYKNFIITGALFLATAFLNNQIMMGGGKRRKRDIENILKSIGQDISKNQISRKSYCLVYL